MLAWDKQWPVQEPAVVGLTGGVSQLLRGLPGKHSLFQLDDTVTSGTFSVSLPALVTQEAGPWPRSGQRCRASPCAPCNLTVPDFALASP